MKVNHEQGYNWIMAQTNEITGFRVFYQPTGQYVHVGGHFPRNHYLANEAPNVISRGDAYRRLAAYLDENPGIDHDDVSVEPVYRQTTPIEDAAHELGGLFEQLCNRHNLNLGLNRAQIDAILVKDLEDVAQKGFGPLLAGVPVRR